MGEEEEQDYAHVVAGMHDGWVDAMGVRFVKVTRTEVVAELDVETKRHIQPLGIVHGGVYSGLVETVTSIGAGVGAMLDGRFPVGLENHTSFLRSVRSGRIRAKANMLVGGKRTQVWEATVTDDKDRIVATGRVRFLIMAKDESLGGRGVDIAPKPKDEGGEA
jgi:1,4-dihydroxy-2-naphthoyl-CoA hydrolase